MEKGVETGFFDGPIDFDGEADEDCEETERRAVRSVNRRNEGMLLTERQLVEIWSVSWKKKWQTFDFSFFRNRE